MENENIFSHVKDNCSLVIHMISFRPAYHRTNAYDVNFRKFMLFLVCMCIKLSVMVLSILPVDENDCHNPFFLYRMLKHI